MLKPPKHWPVLLMVQLPQVHCLFVHLRATPVVVFLQHELVYTYYQPQPKKIQKEKQEVKNGKKYKLVNCNMIYVFNRTSHWVIYCSDSTHIHFYKKFNDHRNAL